MIVLRSLWRHPLARRAPLRALGRLLRWQLRARWSRMPAVVSWIPPLRLIVHRGEHGLTGNLYSGLAEFEDMAFALHLLRPGDVFVDVGANAGAYTLLAAGLSGANVVAVEPVRTTWDRLINNVRLNHLESRVECANLGLAATPGTQRFGTDADTVNHVLHEDAPVGQSEQLPVTTLDALLAGRVPWLVKLDVEGYEHAVLSGAATTLAQPGLKALIVELNGAGSRYGVTDAQVVALLRTHGFTPWVYDPFARCLARSEPGTHWTGNTLFLRDLPSIESRLHDAPILRVMGQKL